MSQDKDNNEAASARIRRDAIRATGSPVPRGGGNTSIDTPEFRERFKYMLRHEYAELVAHIDNFLAHVARQRQESAADTSAVDAAVDLRELVEQYRHVKNRYHKGMSEQQEVDNAFADLTSYIAQQREAGRQSQSARIRHLEHERDEARAALARQPVSEGLTERVGKILAKYGIGVRPSICKEITEQIFSAAPPALPVPMILHCPACGLQHIDAPESDAEYQKHLGHGGFDDQWTNPPHRSHLCRPEDGGCGHIWRPADVPTEGVAAILTRGSNDSAVPPAKAEGMSDTARIEHLEAWLLEGRASGFHWNTFAFDTNKTVREQLDLAQQAKGATK